MRASEGPASHVSGIYPGHLSSHGASYSEPWATWSPSGSTRKISLLPNSFLPFSIFSPSLFLPHPATQRNRGQLTSHLQGELGPAARASVSVSTCEAGLPPPSPALLACPLFLSAMASVRVDMHVAWGGIWLCWVCGT